MSTNRRGLSSYFAIIILIALTTVGGFIIYRTTLPNTKITNNIQTQTNKAIILETKKVQNNTINLYLRNLGTSTQTIEKMYFNDVLASQTQYTININNPGVEDDYLYPQETTRVKITSDYKPGETYKIRIITDLNSIVQTIVKIPETLSVSDESGHWWNTSYQYRRRIQIQTRIAIPESYTVKLVANKNQLEYKPAFEDIRILHYSNTIYQELDRVIRENGEELAIAFKTIENIPSDSQCQDYFLYYCNPSAQNPPDNASRVYLWYDDFSINTLNRYELQKSVDIHGDNDQYKSPTYDTVNQRISYDTGDNYASDMYPKGLYVDNVLITLDFWADKSYPSDATVALVSRMNQLGVGSTHYYYHISHGRYTSPGGAYNSWSNSERNTLMYSPASNTYWSFSDIHTISYGVYENRHILWFDTDIEGIPLADSTHIGYTGTGMVGWAPAQVRGWMDNLTIRKFVPEEPGLTLLEREERE